MLTALQYRIKADEMRALAAVTTNEWTRKGYLNAADNYDRVALTTELTERSRLAISPSDLA